MVILNISSDTAEFQMHEGFQFTRFNRLVLERGIALAAHPASYVEHKDCSN
jgi:hypothetical protein